MYKNGAMLPAPNALTTDPAYAPLLQLCSSVLLTTQELAKHWRYQAEHLHNLRRLQRGPAYIKLGEGAVRYRLSECLAWEIAGHRGPLTLERVLLAMSTTPGLRSEVLEKISQHLATVLGSK